MIKRFLFPEWAGIMTLWVFSIGVNAEEMTVNVAGALQVDAGLFDEDVTPLDSGTEVRRARLGANGEIDDNWSYKVEFEFVGDSNVKDVWIRYTADWGKVTIGQTKVPFSLNVLTSDKYTTLMERAMVASTFGPERRLGVRWEHALPGWYLAAMVFGKEANQDVNGDQGVGFAGRAVWNTQNDKALYHVGLNAMWMEPESTEDDTFVYEARPQSHVTNERLVSVTVTQANSSTSLGLELAARWGSLSAQAEVIGAEVDQTAAGVSDPGFNGYYGFISWFPGGDIRPYKDGVFGRVMANKAWEFAIRYSYIDLDDGVFSGGEETNTTLGVNYYVNPKLRFMANYMHADVKNGVNGDEKPNVFALRMSMDFK